MCLELHLDDCDDKASKMHVFTGNACTMREAGALLRKQDLGRWLKMKLRQSSLDRITANKTKTCIISLLRSQRKSVKGKRSGQEMKEKCRTVEVSPPWLPLVTGAADHWDPEEACRHDTPTSAAQARGKRTRMFPVSFCSLTFSSQSKSGHGVFTLDISPYFPGCSWYRLESLELPRPEVGQRACAVISLVHRGSRPGSGQWACSLKSRKI